MSGYLIWERVDENDLWRRCTIPSLPLTLRVARGAAAAVAEVNGTQTCVERVGAIPDDADDHCPECGGDNRDGNCSPLFDHLGLCADCGEARYAAEQRAARVVTKP